MFFGKISYSLYLWHWPVMVFLQYRLPLETGLLYTAILFTASTALAWLSWRFVENPFRKKDFLSRKTLFIVALFLSAALIAGGLYISKKEGFPDRFPEEILRLYNVKDGMEVPPIPDPPEAADYAGMIGAEEAAPSFMVWGDSHAMAAIPGIDAAARKRGKRGYFVGRHSCMPSYIDLALMEPECNAANHDIVRWLEKHREIKTVILVGHWSMHETRFAKEYRNGRLDNPALLRDTLDTLLEGLEKDNRRVVLMMDPPHAPVYKLPLYVARAKYYDLPLNLDFNLRQYEEQESGVKAALADLKQTHNFTVYDLPAKLCPDQTCPLTVDGRPIYRDDNHFSTYASKAYADIFLPLFD